MPHTISDIHFSVFEPSAIDFDKWERNLRKMLKIYKELDNSDMVAVLFNHIPGEMIDEALDGCEEDEEITYEKVVKVLKDSSYTTTISYDTFYNAYQGDETQ